MITSGRARLSALTGCDAATAYAAVHSPFGARKARTQDAVTTSAEIAERDAKYAGRVVPARELYELCAER